MKGHELRRRRRRIGRKLEEFSHDVGRSVKWLSKLELGDASVPDYIVTTLEIQETLRGMDGQQLDLFFHA